jgi:prophage regulatory protein
MTITLRLLSKKQVKELVLYSNAHLARLEEANAFPKKVRLSQHPRGRCGYLEHEILAWLKERADARRS